MSWTRRFANLLRSNRHARDIDRELAFHVGERTDDLVAAWNDPRAAAARSAQALRQLRRAERENARRRHFHVARRDDRRHALRRSACCATARRSRSSPSLSLGAGHWSEHGDLHADQRRDASVASGRAPRRARAHHDAGREVGRSRIRSGSRFATIRKSSTARSPTRRCGSISVTTVARFGTRPATS